jgi:DNA-binding NarL/FixJ family response regulator
MTLTMTCISSDSTIRPTAVSGQSPIRVLLVDDMPEVRADLRLLLELIDAIEVVGEAGNGREAITLAAQCHPDVVVTDLEMPVMDGCAAARQILAHGLARKVILLSIYSGAELRQRAREAGVRDFIHKGESIERLITAVLEP